ncbi:MAG: hypothetical protein ACFFD2_09790 [Promethearchaeota archaeon]
MVEIIGKIKDKIETVESLINSQENHRAINLLLDIIDFFIEIGDLKNRDKFLLKLNNCYRYIALQYSKQQDFFEAAEIYCSAAFIQKQHDKNELAQQLFNEAIDCFAYAGKTAISRKFYKEASSLYCTAGNYAKNELQDKSKSNNYYKNAINALKKELSTQSNQEDPSNLCQNQLELGKIFEYLEDYPTAITQYKKVVEFSTSKKLYSFIAESFQYMSACYECLGNNSAVTDCLNNAVHYRLLEAKKHSDNNLPLEAVQNFIAAATCVSRLKNCEKLLMDILQSEANCFLTAAKWNAENGQILQAAYYERNAAHCYSQIGKSETSIDLLLTAAEKLLSIDEYYGAAHSYQDVSLYQEQVGNLVKAANYAFQAANSAQIIGDSEFAIQNFKRAAQIYQSIGYIDKVYSCNLKLAECYVNLAELQFESKKFHISAYLYYQAGTFYSNSDEKQTKVSCYEKAIELYVKAIHIAIRDEEQLLASYSACCATLVCLILKQPKRAETILNNIQKNSQNSYYQLSDSIIKVFKTKNSLEYNVIKEKFSKIIQKSPEIKNMLKLIKN